MSKRPIPFVSHDFGLSRSVRSMRTAGACRRAPGPADDAVPQRLTLARGAAFHVYAREGAIFHVRSGRARLTPAPRWLAATVWAAPTSLGAGAAYVNETTGWLLIESEDGAELACHDTAPEVRTTTWLASVWRGLLAWRRSAAR